MVSAKPAFQGHSFIKKTPKIYIQYIFFETVTLFKTNIVVIKKKSLYYLDF